MIAGRRAARAAFVLLLAIAAGSARAQEPAAFRPLGARPDGEPVLRVYVVRHAQAWKNVPASQRPPGLDAAGLDALTGAGQARARAVGLRLRGAGASRVVCSPAQRARQTAQAIASVLGTGAIEPSDAFQPLQHGASRRAADYRWRTENWRAGLDPRPEGGESLADGLARASGFLGAAAQETPGATLVVVTHGEIAAALLSEAAGVSPLAGYDRNFVGEGTISDVAVYEGRWELLAKGVEP
ncbi:MAG: histidine phosphatase family protein [Deltaproteobacteria bacterium]|nr:histidine phosphatase family protein [Deltaproteobacteria bacterium]